MIVILVALQANKDMHTQLHRNIYTIVSGINGQRESPALPSLVILPYSLPNSSADRSLGRILLSFPALLFVLKKDRSAGPGGGGGRGSSPPSTPSTPWVRHYFIAVLGGSTILRMLTVALISLVGCGTVFMFLIF